LRPGRQRPRAQQADRQKATAERFLAARHVPAARFDIVASAFGSTAAVLLYRVRSARPSQAGARAASRLI
jgi:hypothetical protein